MKYIIQIFYNNIKLPYYYNKATLSVVHKSKALAHIAPPDTLRLVYKSINLMASLQVKQSDVRSSAFLRVTKLPRRASQALHGHLFVGGQAAKGV
jgi:hypothetical protein